MVDVSEILAGPSPEIPNSHPLCTKVEKGYGKKNPGEFHVFGAYFSYAFGVYYCDEPMSKKLTFSKI